MPTKRPSLSSDSSSDLAEAPPKRTQRTHEENQERAYIAASRRADRDIEHRIRSALKASECRKKRTGRGLKITREAVLGDEQYESDDDDSTACRFPIPAASNPSQAATANRADRYAEVDALFAQHFPHVQLSSRWATHRPQHQQPLSHSYPAPSLNIHMAFMRQYQAPEAAPASASQASPLPTPPTSYPLPPACEGKSRSMSPLALEGSPTRPSSSVSKALPETASASTTGLGISMLDHSAATNYFLDSSSVDAQPLPETAQPGYPYDTTTTTSQTTSRPLVQAVFPEAGGLGDSRWYRGEPGAAPVGGGGWHMRSLSLPSTLKAYQFPFDMAATTTAGDETMADSIPAPAPAPVDPAVVLATVAAAAQVPEASQDALGETGNAISPLPTQLNEPWAEWVDLDGDVPPPVGVKV
ncbi:uncharacterized protein THITE_2117375 [Thermothielavioides terrestris NRRL 8126]|uniref:Uncharacterized protein n=1 Tax=Thermothielavioides terrestris (strain ATCC 38088 / NRRL 8126) TaxID=578455 RepID=G2R7Z5_THETT|nr:uncharacterized protein THITE_2117375 [Thermothielavioides terrestris NRRL 8126]AEO68054.1 hypothetical protein THITE_2117375 [Thermothielavioides terrestris NRRL 8126]